MSTGFFLQYATVLLLLCNHVAFFRPMQRTLKTSTVSQSRITCWSCRFTPTGRIDEEQCPDSALEVQQERPLVASGILEGLLDNHTLTCTVALYPLK